MVMQQQPTEDPQIRRQDARTNLYRESHHGRRWRHNQSPERPHQEFKVRLDSTDFPEKHGEPFSQKFAIPKYVLVA